MNPASKLVTAIAVAAAAAMTSPAFAGDAQPACAGPTCSGPCAVADTAAQERMGELVTRQRDELISLTRTLGVERKRQTELEAELAQARANQARPAPVVAQGAPAVGDAAVQEENRQLRVQLANEQAENNRLEAKLRTAQKVTDLVFREDAAAAAAVPQPQADDEAAASMIHSALPPGWHAPTEGSAQKSTAWTREIDDYKAPAEPSAQKDTVWTREAMGY